MLKKTITYENPFTQASISEEHYFHISKADMVEMQIAEHKTTYTSKDGKKLEGVEAKIHRIVDSEDGVGILEEIKDSIRRSYGLRDGDKFRKSKEIWEEFASSEAYSQLLFDLCTDAAAGADFINGIFPGDIQKLVVETKQLADQKQETEKDPTGLTEPVTPRVLTKSEIESMPPEDLRSGLAEGRYTLAS